MEIPSGMWHGKRYRLDVFAQTMAPPNARIFLLPASWLYWTHTLTRPLPPTPPPPFPLVFFCYTVDMGEGAETTLAYNVVGLDTPPEEQNTFALHYINAHRDVVEEHGTTLAEKREAARLAMLHKLRAHRPRPFYLVPLRARLITEEPRHETGPHGQIQYDHRWDVRGHERVRFRRGPLPLSTKLADKLLELEYRVHQTKPEGEDLQRMEERGIQWADGEWLALKVRWIDHYIKGPDGAPYVPAIRVGTLR